VPTPLAVGLGEAARLAEIEMVKDNEALLSLNKRFYKGLCAKLKNIHLYGDASRRIPGNLNIGVDGVDGDALIVAMRDIAVSSGSACASARLEPSYVLQALGLNDTQMHSSIRIGLGRFTTEEEIDQTIEVMAKAITKMRALNS